MKRFTVTVLSLFALTVCSFGQSAAQASAADLAPVLYIYEENNDTLDPWKELFVAKLKELGYPYDTAAGTEMDSVNLENYSRIIIHGSVIAFTSKEPVRDWLEAHPNLSGKKIVLFVTANRWFLGKYFDQLLAILGKSDADLVDSVSAATRDLSPQEKGSLVDRVVRSIGSR